MSPTYLTLCCATLALGSSLALQACEVHSDAVAPDGAMQQPPAVDASVATDAQLSPGDGALLLDASPDAALEDSKAPGEAAAELPFDCPAQDWGLQNVQVGSVQLRLACRGQAGPVLLLLHGYPEHYLAWNALAGPLVSAGYRVLAPDQRGHGMSEQPAKVEDYDIDILVEDIRALIELSGQPELVVVGHDWGGLVGFVLAHRHPDLVRGLVVLNAPHPDLWIRPDVDPVQAKASGSYIPLIAGPFSAFSLWFIEPLLAPHLSAEEHDAYRAVWNRPRAVESMNKWYQANVHPTYTLPRDVTVSVPTLALWGMEDTFVTPSELDHLPKFVSNLKVQRFEQVDHWITHQATSQIAESITAFEKGL